jgi:hypothetical protein
MTLVIISFDVYGSRGKEQSTIRHEPSSSPRTHVFRLVRAIPTRNSGVTRTCVHPADIADGAKELEVRGDVEDFWWQMTSLLRERHLPESSHLRVSYLVGRFLS